MHRLQFAVVIFSAIAIAVVYSQSEVTPSEQCANEEYDNLRDRIHVIPCGKSRCKLRKGTNVTVVFKFRPKHEVKSLTNDVYANVAGIPLPFIGVNGVNACSQVTRVDDGSPAPCPLAADQEYTYTNIFFIESFYPAIPLRVHWALHDGKRNVICFEVPAVIAAGKRS